MLVTMLESVYCSPTTYSEGAIYDLDNNLAASFIAHSQAIASPYRATGAGAVALVVDPGGIWKLVDIRMHLSAAGASGTLSIILDAGAGSAYDVVLFQQDMTSIEDLYWQGDPGSVFADTDIVNVTWANASGRTYGIEATVSEA